MVKMKHILILLSFHTIHLGSSFDLPQPLDNFYDEVVRFYKRVRQEGSKYRIISKMIFIFHFEQKMIKAMILHKIKLKIVFVELVASF